jgi:hypothetical protein
MKNKKLVKEAAILYLRRQERLEHPAGGFDYAGRWYAGEMEKCACCDKVKAPSRNFPLTVSQHCRTAKHIAALFGLPKEDILETAKHLNYEDIKI